MYYILYFKGKMTHSGKISGMNKATGHGCKYIFQFKAEMYFKCWHAYIYF